jgi:uncharacterized membrane protein
LAQPVRFPLRLRRLFRLYYVKISIIPVKWDILKDMMKKKILHEFDYYVLLFFALSFIGWLWEVALFFFTDHAFINRGVYRGPYLPIYGVGGLLLVFCLRRFRKNPLLVFLLSALACSVLEYLTSYFLELRWGIRWWDYSEHFLNLNGRVCLLGATVFGLGGALLVCRLLPLYDRMYDKIPGKWKVVLCLVFLLIFIADATYCAVHPNTGKGISGSYLAKQMMLNGF